MPPHDYIDLTSYEGKLGNGFGVSNSPWSSKSNPMYLANCTNTLGMEPTHVCAQHECGNIILPGYSKPNGYYTNNMRLYFLLLVNFLYEGTRYVNLIGFNYAYQSGKLVNNGCYINPYGVKGKSLTGSYSLFRAWLNNNPTNLLTSSIKGEITYRGTSTGSHPWYGGTTFNMNIPGYGAGKNFAIKFLGGTPTADISQSITL